MKNSKKRKLKSWVKETITVIGIVVVFVGIISINNKLTDNFIDNCESQGYTHSYCVSHS